jgi:hypothetical protein
LKRISPFAKAVAPANFVFQINKDLENGNVKVLREVLNVPDELIKSFQKEYSLGRRIIIDSEDFLQVIYRIQFRNGYQLDYSMFRNNAKWTICKSPIELPVSDVALVELPVGVHNATFYVLPIGPKLLLKGQINWGKQTPSSQTIVRGDNLTTGEAQYWFDAICLSALSELICSHRINDILEVLKRAKSNGVAFHKIVSQELAIGAGVKQFSAGLGIRVVSREEFVGFIHSFIQAPEK